MKKIIALILAATFVVGSSACGQQSNDTPTPNPNASLSPEEAAQELAMLFMDDLKAEKEERKFRVTEYKDLSVSVMPTNQMDEETAAIYFLKEDEISSDTWIVEISVSYKYEGTLSPIGPSNGEWIDVLYQGSPVGFLMTKEGNSYSWQPRIDEFLSDSTVIPSFSYKEDSAQYKDGDPGVNPHQFVNVNNCPIDRQDIALTLAEKECTVKYVLTKVSFDSAERMWKVEFYNDHPGGGQTVYLDSNGITRLVVYGE